MIRCLSRSRPGFTLLELLVALLIASLTVITARQLFIQLGNALDTMTAAAATNDEAANSERLLVDLIARIEVDPSERIRFFGNEKTARFRTWCDMPAGWQEQCAALATVESDSSSGFISLRLSTGEQLRLRHLSQPVAFMYLANSRSGGSWLRSWNASMRAPLAIGVVTRSDTVILRVGDRQ